MKNIEDIKTVILKYFSENPDIITVYLHGSFAKGCSRADSDIDIGITLVNEKTEKIRILEISSDLELKLDRPVDIGIVSPDNIVYAKEVILNGECIFCRDEYSRKIREATILSMYVDFQYARREVLDAYRNR